MNKIIEILLGLVLLAVVIYAWVLDFAGFGSAALSFLKGGLMWLVIMIGALFVLLGISDLKN